MANRRPQGGGGGRRDFQRNDRNQNFGRSNVSPWQTGPGPGINSLFPLAGGSKEATLALATNLISLLQPRPNPVPSLLDMPIRRDFGPSVGRFDRNPGPNRMGNQGHFRHMGNFNRSGDRGHNRKPFRANDGPRQQNKNSPRKEADPKSKAAKESTVTSSDVKKDKEENDNDVSENDSKNESTNKDPPKTRYDDINTQYLKCHICNKSMWDGRSFENHLSGRAHAIMMQKTVESYALAADTMRQEYKIREMKRTRKAGQPPSRDFYCAMCDMYAADGAAHRTTVGHRKLKKYLHPSCTSCHKEMPTRIELDEHRLSAEHLRNMQEKSDLNSKPKPEVLVISTYAMEEIFLRHDGQKRQYRRPVKQEERQQEENQEENKDEKEAENEEGDKEKTEATDKLENIDKENTILDYVEGDELVDFTKEQLPVYSNKRGVGRSFIEEFKCYSCKLCNKLLDTQETAEIHLKTWRHHQLFNRLLQEKGGCKTTNEQNTNANNKRKLNSTEEEGNDEKRVKIEKDEEPNGHANKDNDAENEECNADEEFEDWEQSVDDIMENEHLVDEILEDEQYNPEEPNEDTDDPAETNETAATTEKVEEAPQPVVEEEKQPEEPPKPEKEKSPEKTPTPSPRVTRGTPRGTPRGTARGRGGRGRRN